MKKFLFHFECALFKAQQGELERNVNFHIAVLCELFNYNVRYFGLNYSQSERLSGASG